MIRTFYLAIAAGIGVIAAATLAHAQAQTLDHVKQRGTLNCGVNEALPGFSQSDGNGNWRGIDVDYCKAIAAAVLGNPTRVTFFPTPRLQRFGDLQSGRIDVLIRNTTWTSERDNPKFSFVGVNYYDGQGFMVKVSRGVTAIKDLNGAAVCVGTGTTSELNLADYFTSHGMTYRPMSFPNHDETVRAYLADRCDAYTADASSLYSVRVEQARPNDHAVLPEIISKEPLGPSVRQGDSQWFTVVKWVHFALLNAEESGVTQANVDEKTRSSDPHIKRLLGVEGNFGERLGLDNDFAVRVIRAVGNYGEIFERNVGSGSRLRIDRGLNRLWNNGGLHYAPPVR
jgi:general L-amino acid transport system substrate-binding protein